MARYIVGDIQGCFAELQQLLKLISYNPQHDQLFLLGDLVNRGPESLNVLRWAMREQSHVRIVLGNHDLHLLACFHNHVQMHKLDTLADVLVAPDVHILLEWLRCQPLLIVQHDVLITHAGIPPDWDERLAIELAEEVSATLAGPDYLWLLSKMYGNKPRVWSEGLERIERLRLAINGLTRLRMVNDYGEMDFKFKGELGKEPWSLCPWFDYPSRKLAGRKIACGHWSALGLMLRDDVWSLDTGCVWGGKLTAIRLEDGQLYQVPAQRVYQSLDA